MAAAEKKAASLSVQVLAMLYQQQQHIYDQHDELSTGGEHGAGIWRGVMALAASTMGHHPASDVDQAIQLGIAASWINAIIDQLDDGNALDAVAKSIETVIGRAAARSLGAVIYNHSAEAAGVEDFCIELRRQALLSAGEVA